MQAATPEDIAKRKEKIFRKVAYIKNQKTLDAVLLSLPESERAAVLEELKPRLPFQVA